MELSKLVKGITANDVGNTPGVDATTCSSSISTASRSRRRSPARASASRSSAASRSPSSRSSRTCSTSRRAARPASRCRRSRKSGTNTNQRQLLRLLPRRQAQRGRSGRATVLPYQNQQVGGTLRRPDRQGQAALLRVVRVRARAGHDRSPRPSALPGQSFTIPVQERAEELARPRRRSAVDRTTALTARGSRWDWDNPFVLGAGGHPVERVGADQEATNVLGTWSKVLERHARCRKFKGGYNNFHWTNLPQPSMVGTPRVRLSRPDARRAVQLPAVLHQNNFERALRPELAQGQARLEDRRRVSSTCTTPATWFIQQQGS